MTESSSRARLPESSDTRLLIAGIAAFLALMVYLAVAFASTQAPSSVVAPNLVSEVAPWSPYESKLVPIPLAGNHKFAVRVIPATKGPAPGGSFGALVQTLVSYPKPGRYVLGLGLRAPRRGRIGVQIDAFRPGVTRYLVQTTVPATARWHQFRFNLRVKGRWLGLAMYVYRLRQAASDVSTRFTVRGPILALQRG